LNDEADDGVPDGWQRRLRRWPVDSFFPSHFCEATTTMLEEGVSDHGHERARGARLNAGICERSIEHSPAQIDIERRTRAGRDGYDIGGHFSPPTMTSLSVLRVMRFVP
jgi:hypothetical protein